MKVVRISWDNHSLSLVENHTEEGGIYLLTMDGIVRGSVEFLPSYTPSVSIGDQQILIWGGQTLYCTGISHGEIRRDEYEDEILMIYVREETWLVVGEQSIGILDPELRCVTSRWAHNEVLVASYWIGDELSVVDLTNRRFVAVLQRGDRQLSVRPADSS